MLQGRVYGPRISPFGTPSCGIESGPNRYWELGPAACCAGFSAIAMTAVAAMAAAMAYAIGCLTLDSFAGHSLNRRRYRFPVARWRPRGTAARARASRLPVGCTTE